VTKQHKITEMLVSKTLDFNQNYFKSIDLIEISWKTENCYFL